jgi:hypothetical protein
MRSSSLSSGAVGGGMDPTTIVQAERELPVPVTCLDGCGFSFFTRRRAMLRRCIPGRHISGQINRLSSPIDFEKKGRLRDSIYCLFRVFLFSLFFGIGRCCFLSSVIKYLFHKTQRVATAASKPGTMPSADDVLGTRGRWDGFPGGKPLRQPPPVCRCRPRGS